MKGLKILMESEKTMEKTFICHPKCTTCVKAKAWLDAQGIRYTERSIVSHNPSRQELEKWLQLSGLPLKRFFNTSGLLYRERNLSAQLPGMTETEQLDLLATDGMLVKRPILVTKDRVWVGFRPAEWQGLWEE